LQSKRAIVSTLDPESHQERRSLDSSPADVRQLHLLIDQAIRARSMIQLNIQVMASMAAASTKIQNLGPVLAQNSCPCLQEDMANLQQEHKFLEMNVTSLLNRADNLSRQVSKLS